LAREWRQPVAAKSLPALEDARCRESGVGRGWQQLHNLGKAAHDDVKRPLAEAQRRRGKALHLVATLRLATQSGRSASRARRAIRLKARLDAERPHAGSHAERGNQSLCIFLCVFAPLPEVPHCSMISFDFLSAISAILSSYCLSSFCTSSLPRSRSSSVISLFFSA